MRPPLGTRVALAALWTTLAATAFAQAPPEAGAAPSSATTPVCGDAPAQPRIHVQFEDRAIVRDNRRDVQELTRMSGGARGTYHSVMGLTVAMPTARMQWSPPLLAEATGGGVCASAAFTLVLHFSTLEVYLARDLTDACRRGLVDEHELEHVAAWRQHLRAGARLMENALRTNLGTPAFYASPEAAQAAQAAMRGQAENFINTMLPRLRDGVMAAHATIDSPQNYQFTERRMRACP